MRGPQDECTRKVKRGSFDMLHANEGSNVAGGLLDMSGTSAHIGTELEDFEESVSSTAHINSRSRLYLKEKNCLGRRSNCQAASLRRLSDCSIDGHNSFNRLVNPGEENVLDLQNRCMSSDQESLRSSDSSSGKFDFISRVNSAGSPSVDASLSSMAEAAEFDMKASSTRAVLTMDPSVSPKLEVGVPGNFDDEPEAHPLVTIDRGFSKVFLLSVREHYEGQGDGFNNKSSVLPVVSDLHWENSMGAFPCCLKIDNVEVEGRPVCAGFACDHGHVMPARCFCEEDQVKTSIQDYEHPDHQVADEKADGLSIPEALQVQTGCVVNAFDVAEVTGLLQAPDLGRSVVDSGALLTLAEAVDLSLGSFNSSSLKAHDFVGIDSSTVANFNECVIERSNDDCGFNVLTGHGKQVKSLEKINSPACGDLSVDGNRLSESEFPLLEESPPYRDETEEVSFLTMQKGTCDIPSKTMSPPIILEHAKALVKDVVQAQKAREAGNNECTADGNYLIIRDGIVGGLGSKYAEDAALYESTPRQKVGKMLSSLPMQESLSGESQEVSGSSLEDLLTITTPGVLEAAVSGNLHLHLSEKIQRPALFEPAKLKPTGNVDEQLPEGSLYVGSDRSSWDIYFASGILNDQHDGKTGNGADHAVKDSEAVAEITVFGCTEERGIQPVGSMSKLASTVLEGPFFSCKSSHVNQSGCEPDIDFPHEKGGMECNHPCDVPATTIDSILVSNASAEGMEELLAIEKPDNCVILINTLPGEAEITEQIKPSAPVALALFRPEERSADTTGLEKFLSSSGLGVPDVVAAVPFDAFSCSENSGPPEVLEFLVEACSSAQDSSGTVLPCYHEDHVQEASNKETTSLVVPKLLDWESAQGQSRRAVDTCMLATDHSSEVSKAGENLKVPQVGPLKRRWKYSRGMRISSLNRDAESSRNPFRLSSDPATTTDLDLRDGRSKAIDMSESCSLVAPTSEDDETNSWIDLTIEVVHEEPALPVEVVAEARSYIDLTAEENSSCQSMLPSNAEVPKEHSIASFALEGGEMSTVEHIACEPSLDRTNESPNELHMSVDTQAYPQLIADNGHARDTSSSVLHAVDASSYIDRGRAPAQKHLQNASLRGFELLSMAIIDGERSPLTLQNNEQPSGSLPVLLSAALSQADSCSSLMYSMDDLKSSIKGNLLRDPMASAGCSIDIKLAQLPSDGKCKGLPQTLSNREHSADARLPFSGVSCANNAGNNITSCSDIASVMNSGHSFEGHTSQTSNFLCHCALNEPCPLEKLSRSRAQLSSSIVDPMVVSELGNQWSSPVEFLDGGSNTSLVMPTSERKLEMVPDPLVCPVAGVVSNEAAVELAMKPAAGACMTMTLDSKDGSGNGMGNAENGEKVFHRRVSL